MRRVDRAELARDSPVVAPWLLNKLLVGGDCVGGETAFDHGPAVPAEAGRVTVFPHDLPHAGRAVRSGTKVVLRTDVVFMIGGSEP